MASACVNQILDSSSPTSFGWFSPRISFSRDFPANQEQDQQQHLTHSNSLLEDDSCFDFEFRPVGGELKKMHSADELFFDGKLMPLHLSETTTTTTLVSHTDVQENHERGGSGESGDGKILINDIFSKNSSPKAPKCAGGWKGFLGLKKSEKSKTNSSSSKSLKFFLNRNSKNDSSSSSSLNLPLLDSEIEQELPSISSSSRLSLSSSSSSGPDHEDLPLPRLSLDSEKSTLPKVKLTKQLKTKGKTTSTTTTTTKNSGARVGRSAARRASSSSSSSRGVSVDSPRMNSSGKIVFHSLERSSSSPSSFNGGPRMKARGMERSYSANVRIRPVLNVPVCSALRASKSGSVFGFGQLFSSSSQKRDGNGCTRNQSMRRNGSGNNRRTRGRPKEIPANLQGLLRRSCKPAMICLLLILSLLHWLAGYSTM